MKNLMRMKHAALWLAIFLAAALLAQASSSYFNAQRESDAIRAKRAAAHNELYAKGDFSLESHRKIDQAALADAGGKMGAWESAHDELFKAAGVTPPQNTGTDPGKGRRILGDKDLANMSKADFDKMLSAAESLRGPNGETYTVKRSGNSATIEELKLTIHTAGDPGQSPYAKAAGDETFLSLKTGKSGSTVVKDGKPVVKDAQLYNLDNLKKGGHLFDKPSSSMSDTEIQELGKTTKKMLESSYGPSLKSCPPEKLAKYSEIYKKCNDLKLEMTRHSTGLASDEALSQFQQDCKEAASSSLKKTEADSIKKVEGLEAKARSAEVARERAAQALEDAKRLGDQEAISKAQTDFEAAASRTDFAKEQLSTYKSEKAAAEWAVKYKKGPDVLNDLRGVKPEFVNAKSLALDNEPLNLEKIKPPSVEPPSAGRASLGNSPKFVNGVMIVDGVIGAKQAYDDVGTRLPDDMNPYYRKGLQGAAAISTAAGIPVHSGVIAGYDVSMNELTQYYIDESNGKNPSWAAMQARAAAKTAGKVVYDFGYGLAVQPLANIKDIGESIGGAIYDCGQYKKSLLRNQGQQAQTASDAIDSLRELSSNIEGLTAAIKSAAAGLKPQLDAAFASQDAFASRYEDLLKSKALVQGALAQASAFRADLDAGRIPTAGPDIAALVSAVDKGSSSVCATAPAHLKLLQEGKMPLEDLRKSVSDNIEPPFEMAEDAYVKIDETLKAQLLSDPRYLAVNSSQASIEGILQGSEMYGYALQNSYARLKSIAKTLQSLQGMIGDWEDMRKRFDSGASYFAGKSYDLEQAEADAFKAKIREISSSFKEKGLSIDSEKAVFAKASASFPSLSKSFEKAASAPDFGEEAKALAGAMDIPQDSVAKAMLALPGFKAAEAKLVKAEDWMGKLRALCAVGDNVIAVAVKDASSSAAVFGAMVRLKGPGIDVRKSAGQGQAVFSDLLPGRYEVEVVADGYSSASDSALLSDEDGRKELSVSLKASVSARVAQPEPERKEEPVVKREIPNISDEELKKAESAFSSLLSEAAEGVFATIPNIQSKRESALVDRLRDYGKSPAPYGLLHLAFLLDGSNPAIANIAAQAFELQAVHVKIAALDSLCYSGLDIAKLALIRNGLKRDSKDYAAPSQELAKAQALVDFAIAVAKERSLDISSYALWKDYRAFQDAKWGVKLKSAECESSSDYEKLDGSRWLALASSPDGYARVSKDLDSFWTSKEAIEYLKKAGESKFKSANPDIVQNYRGKYIELALIPSMKCALKPQMDAQLKIFVKAAQAFLSSWDAATVSINGSVIAGPDPAPPLTMTVSGLQKSPIVMGVSGAFSISKPLRELSSSSFRYDVAWDRVSLGEGRRFDASRSGDSADLLGPSASVSNFSFKLQLPPLRFHSWNYPKPKYSKGQGIVELPARPKDRNPEFQAQLSSIFSNFSAGAIGVDDAWKEISDVCCAINAYNYGVFTPNVDAIQAALHHNMDVDEEQLRAQGAGGDRINPVLRSYEAKINELTKLENDVSKAGSDMQTAANAAYRKLSDKVNADFSALSKERQRLDAEGSKLFSDCSKDKDAMREPVSKLYSLLSSTQSSRRWQDSSQWNPEALDPSFDAKIPEDLKAASALGPIISGFEPKADALLEARANSIRLSGEALKAARLRYGPVEGGDLRLLRLASAAGDFLQTWRLDSYANMKLLALFMKELDLPAKTASAEKLYAVYASKRGSSLKGFDALLEDYEKSVAALPEPEDIAQAEAEFAPIAGKVLKYAEAISSAVLSGSASSVKLDASMLDAKGSDSAFVHDALSSMRSTLSSHRAAVEPWLEGWGQGESSLEKASACMAKLSSNELTEAQRKRRDALTDKWAKAQSGYKKLCYFCCFKLFEAVESAGKTPAARVQYLLGKNEEAKKELLRVKGNLPSADAMDIAKAYGGLKGWFGVMPDIPTLESVKLRSEVYGDIAKSGVPDACRNALKMPLPPPWIQVNGTKVSSNGACVVLRYSQLPAISADMAKAYERTEYKGKFQRSCMIEPPPERADLRLEISMMGDKNFYQFNYGRPMEMPVSTDCLPMLFTWHFRHVDKVSGASSNFRNEPGITIVILP